MQDNLIVMDAMQQALDSELGYEFSCDDVQGFRRHFYALLKEFPQYAVLELKLSPTRPQERVWLVKKGV